MAQKFSVNPQQIVLGNITLQFGYDPADPSQCLVIAVASGAQTTRSMRIARNGSTVLQADGATPAADTSAMNGALRDASAIFPAI